MTGKELFNVLVKNTGLPEDYVRDRLERLVIENGNTLETITLNDVRELLSDLLLELIKESQREPA